jgi:flavin reductase (DIM6/NTAB) family NADH-FMN oxidoreductase RutF
MSINHQPVELAKSYLLLNHGPVTLVSSAHSGRNNVMAASWAMPLDFDPPKIVLVIDRNTYTRELLEQSACFALNIPCRAIASKVLAAGSCSGRQQDKFAALGLEFFHGKDQELPLVKDCIAWMECRIIPEEHSQQRYDLFIAEVTAAWADPACFSGNRWHFPHDDQRTIHYSAGGGFFATGEAFELEVPENTGQ